MATLTFATRDTPNWLSVTPDGTVSSTAPALGTTKCTVMVTDKSGAVDTSQLFIIAKEAAPPAFSGDAFKRSPATAGKEYKDRVRFDCARGWSSEVVEPNGDALTFSKVSGPDWLAVSSDGSFSSTPGPEDAGKSNTWTVKVTDGDGSTTATYRLDILGSDTVWVEGFDYYPDIKSQAAGDVVHFDAGRPTDTCFVIRGGFPVTEGRSYHDLRTSVFGQFHKFSKGTVCARAIALDESRFAGSKVRCLFRFNLLGVSSEDTHFLFLWRPPSTLLYFFSRFPFLPS